MWCEFGANLVQHSMRQHKKYQTIFDYTPIIYHDMSVIHDVKHHETPMQKLQALSLPFQQAPTSVGACFFLSAEIPRPRARREGQSRPPYERTHRCGGQNSGGCCAPAAGFSYRIVSSCAMVGMPLIAPRRPTQYAPTRLPKARQSASISADCAAMG